MLRFTIFLKSACLIHIPSSLLILQVKHLWVGTVCLLGKRSVETVPCAELWKNNDLVEVLIFFDINPLCVRNQGPSAAEFQSFLIHFCLAPSADTVAMWSRFSHQFHLFLIEYKNSEF